MNKVIKYIKQPSLIFLKLSSKGFFKKMDDEKYLKICYKIKQKKSLNLENPKTFNEKLQWLKLHDRKKVYTTMVDKYEVKNYVSSIIGEKYIIPTFGVWSNYEEIDFSTLPNQFVLKPTHTSGNVFVCRDKKQLNYEELKKEVNSWLKRDYYYLHREWPYKDVPKRIIAEKLLVSNYQNDLIDYKFFCFNGVAKILLICSNRMSDLHETWFDDKFNLLDVVEGNHKIDEKIEKPKNFETMKRLSEILSKDHSFLRVDFYEVDGNVYFGELTFYPCAGYEKFVPEEFNEKLGDYIILPNKKDV